MRHADRSAGQIDNATRVCRDIQQKLSVVGRCRPGAQDRVITCALLQAADTFRCDPDQRVEPVQSTRESRDEKAQCIATFDVRKLMQQCRTARRLRPGLAARWQQQDRLHHAPRARARDVLRFEHLQSAMIEAHARKSRGPTRRRQRQCMASPARQSDGCKQLQEQHTEGANQPQCHDRPLPVPRVHAGEG